MAQLARKACLKRKLRFDGSHIPGTFSCCTASFLGPTFRPRPNAVTRPKVNIPVRKLVDRKRRLLSTDAVALSFVGPGTLPVRIINTTPAFSTGTPLVQHFHSHTRLGDPRLHGYSATGVDLLFQWRFMAKRRQRRARRGSD